ncbi:MAG TPA: hypothetical protein VFZ11_08715 [Gemmatimonadaceae bacterium]
MPLSARHDDPALETLARELYALFPACVRCSEPIARYEEAEVLVHVNRLAHRGRCDVVQARRGEE